MDLRELFSELKRRRVVRAAVAYAAALFLILQVADIVLPAVGLPDSVMTGLVVVGALGFPIAIALAWALDLTPRGIERAADVDSSSAATPGEKAASVRGGLWGAMLLGAAFAVVVFSGWWVLGRQDGGDDAPIRALAVLPLANLMGDEAQRHFVDGMHDILIGELARVDGLSVISQRSVLRFRDSDLPLDAIADELDVDALIEGSVFRQGDSVRVTARLIRADPETDLWNRTYEGELREAMTLQSRVARAVADQIEITLTRETAEHLDRETEVNPEAMDTYLLARDLWRSRDLSRMRRAIELFERAVEIDSTFALGWAGVADGYTIALGYGVLPRDSAIGPAQTAIDRALALDPGLMEAHAANGALLLYVFQDFDGAVRELSRVVELAPSYAQAHNWLADGLGALGRREEALRSFERAIELDPLSALMWRDYARGLLWVDRCEESIRAARRALEIDPQHFYAREQMARCQIRLGRDSAAVEMMLGAFEVMPVEIPEAARDSLAAAWREGGMEAFLRAQARSSGGLAPHVVTALHYARAGAIDAAFEEIFAALDVRESLLFSLRADPTFQILYDDPRWDEALRRLEALDEESRR